MNDAICPDCGQQMEFSGSVIDGQEGYFCQNCYDVEEYLLSLDEDDD